MRFTIREKLVVLSLAILIVVSFVLTLVHFNFARRLVEEDLLECADSGIRLTRTGLLHADSVFAALM